jgi:hypothetical protein
LNRALACEITGFLRVSGPPGEHLRKLRQYRQQVWNKSLDWLDLSGLALAFWERLQRLGAVDTIPREVAAYLASSLTGHRMRVAAMRQEFDSLNRRFEDVGVEYAALKGFTLVPDYCLDAYLRPSYDYDYLISDRTLGAAQEVLRAAGFIRKEDRARHHATFVPSRLPPKGSFMREGLYSATLPRKVELHSRLWDEVAFRIPLRVPERPLDRRLQRRGQGLIFYSLAEEDAFVFQALHTFQHILHNWCRLRWLLDIAYFLERRSRDASFWMKCSAALESNEPLSEVVGLVVSLASGLFHAAIPAAIEGRLRGAIRGPVSRWIESYGMASALDNFANNKYALFLYREFVQDKTVWREVRKSLLLPLHRPNRVAGAVAPANAVPGWASWAQGWYVAQRLIHHSVKGARYVWETRRWQRLRRMKTDRVLPAN